jgi:cell division protein FtsZ
MKESGVAVMGTGLAAGEGRAIKAIENALASPLLNSNDITGAKSILVNISSGTGNNELTMDELGEITDYMYEAASEDALIIRGLSQDESLGDNLSVTVIATGFPANSIFIPYKKPKPKKVELLAVTNPTPPHVIPDKGNDVFTVHEKQGNSVISTIDDEIQGELDFNLETAVELTEMRSRKPPEDAEESEKRETTLQKVKHMQNFIKKEGLSNKIIKDNIDTFEDVPAYIRRNMPIGQKDKNSDSKISKFTLSSGEDNEPVLRENNAYLNDNVD